ncbi:MAG: ATP-dependent sacrificial sulfur transferase LarE [Deltaproteobacteria bacterium]|nr:ATP-dependent sacrificial sulfur transferase LarE [Deltaproteobacteria bacterium]
MINTNDHLKRLEDIIGSSGSMLVAFSGGTDSTLVTCVARRVLGKDKLLAVTAGSRLNPQGEIEAARSLAAHMDVTHLVISAPDVTDPIFSVNDKLRCYYCKKLIFTPLLNLAGQHGLAVVADGSNTDDEKDYRPGAAAAAELGIRSPLREAGLSKMMIRKISRSLDLTTWDKPAQACLASRVPYGEPVTEEKLVRIEQAETILHRAGFDQVRVRHHDRLARIELLEDDVSRLGGDYHLRREIGRAFRGLGFSYVSLDLLGYRTGSLNEVLEE